MTNISRKLKKANSSILETYYLKIPRSFSEILPFEEPKPILDSFDDQLMKEITETSPAQLVEKAKRSDSKTKYHESAVKVIIKSSQYNPGSSVKKKGSMHTAELWSGKYRKKVIKDSGISDSSNKTNEIISRKSTENTELELKNNKSGSSLLDPDRVLEKILTRSLDGDMSKKSPLSKEDSETSTKSSSSLEEIKENNKEKARSQLNGSSLKQKANYPETPPSVQKLLMKIFDIEEPMKTNVLHKHFSDYLNKPRNKYRFSSVFALKRHPLFNNSGSHQPLDSTRDEGLTIGGVNIRDEIKNFGSVVEKPWLTPTGGMKFDDFAQTSRSSGLGYSVLKLKDSQRITNLPQQKNLLSEIQRAENLKGKVLRPALLIKAKTASPRMLQSFNY